MALGSPSILWFSQFIVTDVLRNVNDFVNTVSATPFFQSTVNTLVNGFNVNSSRPSDAYASANYPIIGPDNGLPPVQRQAIIWTSVCVFSVEPKGTKLSEISNQM